MRFWQYSSPRTFDVLNYDKKAHKKHLKIFLTMSLGVHVWQAWYGQVKDDISTSRLSINTWSLFVFLSSSPSSPSEQSIEGEFIELFEHTEIFK